MKQIQFTITEEEVRNLSEKELSDKQVQEILTVVENNQVLWQQMEDSIKEAISLIYK